MEIWEEPVRGGYPEPWTMLLIGDETNIDLFMRHAPAPPMAHLTGLWPREWNAEEGQASMPATGWLASPQGRIPLGALAIVADMGFGMALNKTLDRGAGFTTAELSLTRVREPAMGGDLVVRSRLIHFAGAMALTEAQVYDREGMLVAAGMSRLTVFPPPPELPDVPEDPPLYEPPVYDTPDPWQRQPEGEVVDGALWAKRSGLDILRAHIAGEIGLPPIGRLTGLRVVDAEPGSATVVMPATAWLTTPGGTVQGGFTALIADTALACAVQTVVERGNAFMPVDVKVNYLRPVFPDAGLLTATATVTHQGRSLAIAHARVTNAEGKPVALATGSAALAGPVS